MNNINISDILNSLVTKRPVWIKLTKENENPIVLETSVNCDDEKMVDIVDRLLDSGYNVEKMTKQEVDAYLLENKDDTISIKLR